MSGFRSLRATSFATWTSRTLAQMTAWSNAEGAELPIIRGGLDVIRRCRPPIVFETGNRSTPYYGVGPDDIFSTIVEQLGMHLSTMTWWLEGRTPYTRRRFRNDYRYTNEFYFIAY